MEDNIKNHLKALIQLSCADNSFDNPEKLYVYAIGKANQVNEKEIDMLVDEVLTSKENSEVNYGALLPEERFDYLCNIIQLMKIDGEVFLSEIVYCEEIAEKLGYDKKVVKNISSHVYANPSITGNRKVLMKEVNKYLK